MEEHHVSERGPVSFPASAHRPSRVRLDLMRSTGLMNEMWSESWSALTGSSSVINRLMTFVLSHQRSPQVLCSHLSVLWWPEPSCHWGGNEEMFLRWQVIESLTTSCRTRGSFDLRTASGLTSHCETFRGLTLSCRTHEADVMWSTDELLSVSEKFYAVLKYSDKWKYRHHTGKILLKVKVLHWKCAKWKLSFQKNVPCGWWIIRLFLLLIHSYKSNIYFTIVLQHPAACEDFHYDLFKSTVTMIKNVSKWFSINRLLQLNLYKSMKWHGKKIHNNICKKYDTGVKYKL